jgi:hypothetical protein
MVKRETGGADGYGCLIGGVFPPEALAAEMAETQKRCALHGNLGTAYARVQFRRGRLAEHATAAFA